ncbi:ATP-binding protein [Paenibacillus filicis]|uniref:histidine kinase n=1 Tax=Paenibacillus gyeongsangnamensis TaxID=3388067 RepID=A0ABT4QCP9_9BACL|nr:ATP-binding protein [Paenibacillus filicis]MCZ8514552.1 ATP-binding protein [Paenibacillus filicis]
MIMTRSRMSIIYVIVIISLLAMVSISSFMSSLNTERQLNIVVSEAIPLANTADSILTDVINQESGVRGFLNTSDEKYLEPYDSGKLQLQQDLDAMAVFQKKYPRLRSIMEGDMLPQIQRLQDYYASEITLVRTDKKDEALSRTNNGKALMDRFRQLHSKLTAEIDVIANTAYVDAQNAERSARVIITIGGLIAIVIGGISLFIFNRANRAEAALRKSEETYRYMAESLEAQNEEIIAQQEEQELTLEKLSQREMELEAITGYQEKLTGAMEMKSFLEASVPALLESVQLDAAVLVVRNSEPDGPSYKVLYSVGYPTEMPKEIYGQLLGPARRVLEEKRIIESKRDVSELERGVHYGVTSAVDRYYPIFDDQQEAAGFLLLTGYLTTEDEQKSRLAKGLIRQFGLAFLAQQMNEERLAQSVRLEQLNEQLQQEKELIGEHRDVIENILESTHEGMMMCDAQGFIRFANRRMKDYFGNDEFKGAYLTDICSKLQKTVPTFSGVLQTIDGLLRGELDKLTERFALTLPEVQQPRYVELYATKVGEKSGQEQGFLFVFRDRTEEEKVDEMKNEFISIVSHELRTPLASVLGFIEILLHRQLPAEKQHRYLQTIYNEANRLSTLINDFLDLQRMEAGKQTYHFTAVELGSLVQEIAEQWKGRQGHQIELHLPSGEAWVRADADRFKQVAHNLLSNAIKYSPQADKVEITLNLDQDHVDLEIQDYGLGIPEEAKEKLFSKFYRVDNSDRRQIGGTGLGLSIVKEIVEAHQGEITFHSEMGKGTTFRVRLNAYRLPPADNAIMILEDDDNLSKLIEITLGKLQIPVMKARSAEDGILALHRIAGNGPRLCIVDIHLEGAKSGWDFIGELYRHPKFYRTPVIVSTALEPPTNYHEKDIEKYLRKPFTMEKLLAVSEQLLLNTENQPAYIFPRQDESIIASTLAKNGIEVEEIKSKPDLIEVELKPKSSGASET